MFAVYKITNNFNHKCYIGSSIRVTKRWQEHIQKAKNPNSKEYQYPLYRAFRKYGIDNFSFEILKDDFESAQEMQLYEQQMIIAFDSCNSQKGYNQTLATSLSALAQANNKKYIEKISQKCAKVDIDENIITIYPSYHEAARQNIQTENPEENANIIRQICKGEIAGYRNMYFRDLDEKGQVISKPIKKIHGKKSIIGIKIDSPDIIVFFESISEAARQLKIDRSSITQCIAGSTKYSVVGGYIFREIDLYGTIIENSIDIESKIQDYADKYPEINGERHSISEWAKIYGIQAQTIRARKRHGWDLITAITTPLKK